MFLKSIISPIINNYDLSSNLANNYIYKAINKYLLLLLLIFVFQFLTISFFVGFKIIASVHLFMIIYYLIMLSLKKKTYVYGIHINFYSFISYLVLIFSISFLSIYTHHQININYYFFPIISSIPFLYNLKENKYFVLTISIVLLLVMYSFDLYKIEFLSKNELSDLADSKILFLKVINTSICILAVYINIYFVYKKDEFLFNLVNENEILLNNLNELEDRFVVLLQKQFTLNNVKKEDIEELYRLAETNSEIYLEKFCNMFPSFQKSLNLLNQDLSRSEFYFCSLIKLNYGTKKIAQILDISVRAVESKKYRLKKKLNINLEQNIQEFILSL